MSLFEELKRRNVFRVAVAYLVTAWLALQVADIVLETIEAPLWVMQVLMLLLGIGFPIALILAWAFELTPEGIKKEKDVDRAASITRQTGRKLDFTIIGILLVAVVFLLADRFIGFGQQEPSILVSEETDSDRSASSDPAPSDNSRSIAVLPFVNMSSDEEQEFFSDGISEEILNSLASVSELKVAGRTSSFAFKDRNEDLRVIGTTLGVDHILEGSVRKSGNKVRITAQLIQVEDGFHLWSETYDRELTDVFVIQDEIATAILEELKPHLLENEEPRLLAQPTDSEVYDLYLLARQRIYERSRPALEDAARMLDEAIEIDPDYAPAYAQRGITELLLADDQYGVTPREQANAQAKIYLDKALALSPDQPEALAGMGLLNSNSPGQEAVAVELLEKALKINPNLINARNWLQGAYAQTGRLEEAIRSMEDLYQRDPLYRPGFANLSRMYLFRGDFDQVQSMIERVRPFMPNDPFLLRIEANAESSRGNPAACLKLIERALEIQPDHGPNLALRGSCLLDTYQLDKVLELGIQTQRIEALWELGRLEEATMLARELADSGEDPVYIISLLANSDDPEKAIEYFEQRWGGFDSFEAAHPLSSGAMSAMIDLAYAYGFVGDEERFLDAMQRSRSALDRIQSLGFNNAELRFIDGVHHAMMGDREKALLLIASAIDLGYFAGRDLAFGWDGLKVLKGEPEFHSIEARMIQHLNEERAQLDLEPVSI